MNGKCKTEGDLTGQSCSCGYLAVTGIKCAQNIPYLTVSCNGFPPTYSTTIPSVRFIYALVVMTSKTL